MRKVCTYLPNYRTSYAAHYWLYKPPARTVMTNILQTVWPVLVHSYEYVYYKKQAMDLVHLSHIYFICMTPWPRTLRKVVLNNPILLSPTYRAKLYTTWLNDAKLYISYQVYSFYLMREAESVGDISHIKNLYCHYFIWQLRVATFYRLVCRLTQATHTSGRKWQTILVRQNNEPVPICILRVTFL